MTGSTTIVNSGEYNSSPPDGVSSQCHDTVETYTFEEPGLPLYPAIDPSKNLKTELPFNLVPGVGYKSSKTCGEVRSAAACAVEPEHFKREYPLKCGKLTCPVCYPLSIAKTAKMAADRVHGFIDAVRCSPGHTELKKDVERWMHVVISPPPQLFDQTDDSAKMCKIGIGIAKQLGLMGGYLIYHPYRINPQYRDMFIDMNQALIENDCSTEKFWSFIRRDVLNLGHWTKYLIFSPHYHIVGFGFLMNVQDFHTTSFYGLPGWVYKNLNPNGIDLDRAYNLKDVGYHDHIVAILSYQLDHAAYVPGKRSLRSFGLLRPTFIKKLEEVVLLDVQRAICPVCSAPVVRYEVDEWGEYILPSEPVQCVCKLKQHKYEIRTRKRRQGAVVKFKTNNSELKEKLRL